MSPDLSYLNQAAKALQSEPGTRIYLGPRYGLTPQTPLSPAQATDFLGLDIKDGIYQPLSHVAARLENYLGREKLVQTFTDKYSSLEEAHAYRVDELSGMRSSAQGKILVTGSYSNALTAQFANTVVAAEDSGVGNILPRDRSCNTYIVMLHGSTANPSGALLSEPEVAGFTETRPRLYSLVKGLLLERPWIILGFDSISDGTFGRICWTVCTELGLRQRPLYVIDPREPEAISTEWPRDPLRHIRMAPEEFVQAVGRAENSPEADDPTLRRQPVEMCTERGRSRSGDQVHCPTLKASRGDGIATVDISLCGDTACIMVRRMNGRSAHIHAPAERSLISFTDNLLQWRQDEPPAIAQSDSRDHLPALGKDLGEQTPESRIDPNRPLFKPSESSEIEGEATDYANRISLASERELEIESLDGRMFRAKAPHNLRVSSLGGQFIRRHVLGEQASHRERAVVDIARDGSWERLNGNETLQEAGVINGDRLRVYSDTTAGGGLVLECGGWMPPKFLGEGPLRTFRQDVIVEPKGASLEVKWQSPIYHPNIRAEDGLVAQELIDDLILKSGGAVKGDEIGSLLSKLSEYTIYDLDRGVLNKEAAIWAQLHQEQIIEHGGRAYKEEP